VAGSGVGPSPVGSAEAAGLQILADIFSAADEYIIVDDLYLSHVDGWTHYHAWEFVPTVQQGDLELTIPR
jgi:hypothetical protein